MPCKYSYHPHRNTALGILIFRKTLYLCAPKFLKTYAEVAQLVEHDLAKVGVAGSSLVFRSVNSRPSGLEFFIFGTYHPGPPGRAFKLPAALVAEQVDAQDLKSCLQQCEYGFDSRLGHKNESGE